MRQHDPTTQMPTDDQARDQARDLTRDLTHDLARDLDGTFERFVLAWQHRIYGFALRLCAQPQDAEELAQDTFVRAYHALAAYDRERIRALNLRAWLYQITLNAFRNRVARRRLPVDRLDGATDPRPLRIVGDRRDEPETALGARELRAVLAARIRALPPALRVAVVLRYVEGFSYAEMAALLEQPDGTVKSNICRGTRLLREMLASELCEACEGA